MESAQRVDVDALHEALTGFTGGLCSNPVALPLEMLPQEELEEGVAAEGGGDGARRRGARAGSCCALMVPGSITRAAG